ncbi:hypothetical protein H9W90_00250 [Polaribacter pectinis]|uniref:Glutaminyl-tRNA synthetase n=1 Tax=Polaribacter pectinis TaxID=2738844 RepID=A0A7G9LAE0_9FLAO|nr:hypothetical protein [Polaribacter pectinis]QNM85589.1 hypothetical protein H9W90_00250 [Polaribacter pectinis]
MKNYQNFEEIDRDLKKLSLERKIALEELKIVKSDFEESLRPLSMLQSVFKFASKYGVLLLVKKIFK